MSRVDAPDDEDEGSIDLRPLRDWASYLWWAVRRHPLATLISVALVIASAGFVAWAIPDRYRVETKLLAQRPDAIAVLANPARAAAFDGGAATRAVADLVLRHENLVGLVRQTDLVAHWRATRPPLLRLKDRLLLGALDDDAWTVVLVEILESRLAAWAHDGAVSISVTWNDAEMAYRLADTALQNFLETRHVSEMAILGESISLLEARLTEAQRELEQAMREARSERAPRRPRATAPARAAASAAPTEQETSLARQRGEIEAKRRTVGDLVAFRNRRLAELQGQLAEQRAVYSDSHPVVVNLQRSLEALAIDSPQLVTLRSELRELEARYVASGGSVVDFDVAAPNAEPPATVPAIITALERPSLDPSEEYAQSRLAAAIARYYSVIDRLEAVRVERDAARAGAKFRYLVVRPPLLPREAANRGRKRAIWAAGAIGGLLLGALVALGLELHRGRIVQPWQVERTLGLPVLAELPATVAQETRERTA